MDDKAYYEFISSCIELLSKLRGCLHDLLMTEGYTGSQSILILSARHNVEDAIQDIGSLMVEASRNRVK